MTEKQGLETTWLISPIKTLFLVERYLRECWESQNTRRIDTKAVVHDNQKALAILAKNNYVISKVRFGFTIYLIATWHRNC